MMRLAIWQALLPKSSCQMGTLAAADERTMAGIKGGTAAAKEHAKQTKPRYSTCNSIAEQRPYAKNT
jgi:hypothetical protein